MSGAAGPLRPGFTVSAAANPTSSTATHAGSSCAPNGNANTGTGARKRCTTAAQLPPISSRKVSSSRPIIGRWVRLCGPKLSVCPSSRAASLQLCQQAFLALAEHLLAGGALSRTKKSKL